MITIRLAGGFGNQLFQLSAAILLAKTHKISEIIIDDSSLAKYKTKNNNMLCQFLDFSRFDINISINSKLITKLRVPKVMPILFFISDDNFDKALARKLPFYILDGYFQDCFTQKQFEETAAEVKCLLVYSELLKIKSRTCVIHIRGGDYVKLGLDVLSPPEYYHSAIEFMHETYGIKSFLVITDDELFAKKIINLDYYQFEFLCGTIESDFQTIGSYPYQILSASTFSFWACIMGVNTEIVIAPRRWPKGASQFNRVRLLSLPNEVDIFKGKLTEKRNKKILEKKEISIDHSLTYKKFRFKNVPHILRLKSIVKCLRENIEVSNLKYADVGCSNGYITDIVSKTIAPKRTVGFDHSDNLIDTAKEKFSNYEFFTINLNDVNKQSESFDVVTCFETLEHVGNIKNAIRNLSKLTKNGGKLIITVPIEIEFVGLFKYIIKRYVYRYSLSLECNDFSYLSALIKNQDISKFRAIQDHYSSHFGFDYRVVDKALKDVCPDSSIRTYKAFSTKFYVVEM